MEQVGEQQDGRLAAAISSAESLCHDYGVPWLVFYDSEVDTYRLIPEADLALPRFAWVNLALVKWTSARGVLPDDLLDEEYKRLAALMMGGAPC